MSWLRLDDGTPEHRKILALPRKDRWTWLELLCYVARQNNGGHVPSGICDILRWVTPTFLERCTKAGLLDEKDGLVVHDWSDYNSATTSEKVASFLQRNPSATANEIHRVVGGKREVVLAEVAKHQGSSVPERFPSGTPTVPESVPSRGRARTPTPKNLTTTPTEAKHDGGGDPRLETLTAAGWVATQTDAITTEADLERALSWITHCTSDHTVQNPGGLAWTKYQTGAWPPEQRSEIAPGAQGTRSISPPLPDRPTDDEPERITPPPDFLALAQQTSKPPPPLRPPPSLDDEPQAERA